jgi:hypothetical protein
MLCWATRRYMLVSSFPSQLEVLPSQLWRRSAVAAAIAAAAAAPVGERAMFRSLEALRRGGDIGIVALSPL